MNQIIIFKPKIVVYLSVVLFLVIGIAAPFWVYSQTTEFNTPAYIKICFPPLVLIPTVMAIRKIKTIQINEGEWMVKYLFTGKKIVFSKNDVHDTVVSEHVRYKSGMPYTNWKITLLSGEIIQFSSNELQNTDQIVLHFRKIQIRK